jgi:hypothetical protein
MESRLFGARDGAMYLSQDRYRAALRRLQAFIVAGNPLAGKPVSAELNTPPPSCSWGFCSHDREHWPDEQDWLTPPMGALRVVPKYRDKTQPCPFEYSSNHIFGCYHRCTYFEALRDGGPLPTQKHILDRIESLVMASLLTPEEVQHV